MLDLSAQQEEVLDQMQISLDRFFEHQTQQHNETMRQLEIIQNQQTQKFKKLYQGQKEIFHQELQGISFNCVQCRHL